MIKSIYRETRRRFGVVLSPNLRRELKGEVGFCNFAHGRVSANHLAKLYGYKSYLEIGVKIRENNMDKVQIPEKVGVDPNPATKADFIMISDEFFEENPKMRFDLIFVDGLHTGDQVARDIANSLRALNPSGVIVLHDLNPPTAEHAREVQQGGATAS